MKPVHSLVGLSLVIALIWRLEVELRGWDGLAWIGYYHLAIPIGGALLLMWIWIVTTADPGRDSIVGLTAAWGVGAAVVLEYASKAYFVAGPAAIILVPWRWLCPVVWVASILMLFAGYRRFFRFPPAAGWAGFALWTASWYLGLLLTAVLPERGKADLIHALKTGWMIPFCVLAVGLPIAYKVTPTHESDPNARPPRD